METNWIKCSERLPEYRVKCLVVIEGHVDIAYRVPYGRGWYWIINSAYSPRRKREAVTAWAEMPAVKLSDKEHAA